MVIFHSYVNLPEGIYDHLDGVSNSTPQLEVLHKNPHQLRGMMCTSPFQDEKTFGFLTLGKLSSRRPAPSCSWPWIQGAMKGVGAGMGLGLADATFVPSGFLT